MTVRSMRAAQGDLEVSCAMRTISDRSAVGGDPAWCPSVSLPADALAMARELYNGRRKRSRVLAGDMFGEPTWDILLDLYVALGERRQVPTTSACIGADVPPTTALRWLRILEARGLVEREDDGRDGRRTFVRLTARGQQAMTEVLENWARAMRPALLGTPPLTLERTGSAVGAFSIA